MFFASIKITASHAPIHCQSDIQTIGWGEVVRRIGNIRQENALTSLRNPADGSVTDMHDVPKLDAHDVAK